MSFLYFPGPPASRPLARGSRKLLGSQRQWRVLVNGGYLVNRHVRLCGIHPHRRSSFVEARGCFRLSRGLTNAMLYHRCAKCVSTVRWPMPGQGCGHLPPAPGGGQGTLQEEGHRLNAQFAVCWLDTHRARGGLRNGQPSSRWVVVVVTAVDTRTPCWLFG